MELIGTRLGPYEIRGHLGRGGCADVYRALHAGLSKEVALKVLFADSADDVEQIQRFQRESRVLARLRHPGIVEVYDSGSEGVTHYFAMELLEHRTLAEHIDAQATRAGLLAEPRVVAIISSLLEVLSVVHSAQVIHRDLKPSNIFVTPEDAVVVSDFGLVKVVDEASLAARPDSVLGTLQYMAPEQILSEPADVRTDLYAVGLVLYRMLYGVLPFGAQMAEIVQKKTLQAGLKAPAQALRPVSRALEDACLRACRRDRRERFAAAEEFLAALAPLNVGQPVSRPMPARPEFATPVPPAPVRAPAPPPPPVRAPAPRRRRGARLAWALAGALGASLAVGLAVRQLVLQKPAPTGAPPVASARATAAPVADPRALVEAAEACREAASMMGSECYKVFIASVLAPDLERLRTCYEEDVPRLDRAARRIDAAWEALRDGAAREGGLQAKSAVASLTLYRYLVTVRRRGVAATVKVLEPLSSGALSQEAVARLQPAMSTDAAASMLLVRHATEVRMLGAEMARAPERVEAEAGRLADDVRTLGRLVGLLVWTPETSAAVRDHLRVLPEVAGRAAAPVGPALGAALASVRTAALNSGRGELTRAMARSVVEDLAALRAVLPGSGSGLTTALTDAWRDLDRTKP